LTLKAQIVAMPHVIAILQNKVTHLSTDFGCLVGEVSALRSAAAGIQTLSEEVSALKNANWTETERSDRVTTFNGFPRTSERNFHSENANYCDVIHCHSISESSTTSIFSRYINRCADHFGLSGDLRRVPKQTIFASVAGQSRWFQSTRISPPM
jgi:hypothetical protein